MNTALSAGTPSPTPAATSKLACRKVFIVAARSLALADASALSLALKEQAVGEPMVLDAELHIGSDREAAASSTNPQGVAHSRLSRMPALRCAALATRIFQMRRRAHALIAEHSPSAVVIFDDRHIIPDRVMIDAAHHRGIPVALVPYAVSSLESDVFVREHDLEQLVDSGLLRTLKRRIASHTPQQMRASRSGDRLLFYPPLETVVLKQMGLLADKPWVYGGSGPDLVCAMGPDHLAYMTTGGVARDRIELTGQPSLDHLVRTPEQTAALKAALAAKHGFDPARPLLICAVPQHAEHGMADPARHQALTSELFWTLAASGLPVLLSLHPKSRRETYAATAEAAGLQILDQRLLEVLPAADLLIAAFSSTIGWVVGLGRPAIAFDNIDSGFELYKNLSGVKIARSASELRRILQEIATSPSAWDELRSQAQKGQQAIGALDGRNAERTARAISRLMNNARQ